MFMVTAQKADAVMGTVQANFTWGVVAEVLSLFQIAAFHIDMKKYSSFSHAPLSEVSITIIVQLNHDIFITYFCALNFLAQR